MRILVAMVFVLGCKSTSTGAKEIFAEKFSCPEDQVTVTARPDLDAADELAPDMSKEPSAEVAADPVRLAKFTADQDRSRAAWMSSYVAYDMFEVSGCGHTMTLGCHHPQVRGATHSEQVSCEQPRDEKRQQHDADKAARKKAREDAKKRASATPSGP